MRHSPAFLLLCLFAVRAGADDGAASIAAGGILTMKREPRIVMAKEMLRIGLAKVVVDYDFRNDSDIDIDTIVAFPIAPYTWERYYTSHEEAFSELGGKRSESRIASFRLVVDGRQEPYRVSAKALLHGRDEAMLLRSMKVDPVTFGHLSEGDGRSDFDALTPEQLARLRSRGLISKDPFPTPLWTVKLRYYWSQHFPARGVVKIHHEYKPITGEQQSPPYFLPGGKPAQPEAEADTIRDTRQMWHTTCVPEAVLQRIGTQIAARSVRELTPGSKEHIAEYFRHMLVVDWVDFILTTANTWRQPIEDFTLEIEEPPFPKEKAAPAFFCGDGPLIASDGRLLTYHASNFVPSHELRVGYFRYD